MFSLVLKHCLVALILQLFELHSLFCKVFEMEKEKIVPDVIPVAPKEIVQISYNNLHVRLGNEFTPSQVKFEPRIAWNTEAGAFYTLCMIDPDVPCRVNPTYAEVQHWLIGNIPGITKRGEPLDITRGETLTEYVGSGPTNGTGLHRYVFLVYKQPEKLKFDEEPIAGRSRKGRQRFKISKFAEKYKLGDPIAGNFYVAQYDDWVPQLNKLLDEGDQ